MSVSIPVKFEQVHSAEQKPLYRVNSSSIGVYVIRNVVVKWIWYNDSTVPLLCASSIFVGFIDQFMNPFTDARNLDGAPSCLTI